MRTLSLDPLTHDFIRGTSVDAAALATLIKQKLLTWKGEHFLDKNLGVDYDTLLGSKPKNLDVQALFKPTIESVGYGVVVETFTADLDNNRKLSVKFTVNSDFGRMEISI